MSATVKAKPPTIQQRSADATARLRKVLGVPDLAPATIKMLSAAVAEAAADEAEGNPAFASRVHEIFETLMEQASKPKRTRQQRERIELVPLASFDVSTYDPFAPPDPYFLLRIYGGHQLAAALSRYNLTRLKPALAAVEERNPGTRPTNRSKREAVIDYIVEHVAGPGY